MAFNPVSKRLTLLVGDSDPDSSDSEDSYADYASCEHQKFGLETTNSRSLDSSLVAEASHCILNSPEQSDLEKELQEKLNVQNEEILVKANHILKLEDTIRALKATVDIQDQTNQKTVEELQEKIQIQAEEITLKTKHVSQLRNTIKSLNDNIEQLGWNNEKTLKEGDKFKLEQLEYSDNLRMDIENYIKQLFELQKKVDILDNENTMKASYIKDLEETICRRNTEVAEELRERIQVQDDENKRKTHKIAELEDSVKKLNVTVEILNGKNEVALNELQDIIRVQNDEITQKAIYIKELQEFIENLNSTVANLNQDNEKALNNISEMKNPIRRFCDAYLQQENGKVSGIKYFNKIKDCLMKFKVSMLSELEGKTVLLRNKEQSVQSGLEELHAERRNVEKVKAEAADLLRAFEKLTQNGQDQLTSFGKAVSEVDTLIAKVEALRISKTNEHVNKYHQFSEEEREMKKQVTKRRNSFIEHLEEFKTLDGKVVTVFENISALQQKVTLSLSEIKEAILKQESLKSSKSCENVAEGKEFHEKLISLYWNDEDNPTFNIGMDAHKYIVGKKLKIEEKVLRNQFISLMQISKEDDDSLKETFSTGYGDTEQASFVNAVENMKNNKQFMKKYKAWSTASVCSLNN